MAEIFIGIPTLNRPDYVRDAIESVRSQTYRDVRVVVSDNASDPGVADSIERHIAGMGDDRFHLHRQPTNVGECGQGRYFLAEAAEPYLLILHDDDVLEPEYLANAVSRLQARPDIACFVANPYLMDAERHVSRERTEEYHRARGRHLCDEGEIDVLETLFGLPSGTGAREGRPAEGGFIPLSGTVFRTDSLRASGFIDEDMSGNYPFEFNVLLRLGERGAKAWFSKDELLGFRYHDGSMTNYIRLVDNPRVIDALAMLLERRRFCGAVERRRRVYLARYLRAGALIRLRRGEARQARRMLARAIATRPGSLKAWACVPPVFLVPGLGRRLMPTLPEAPMGPSLAASSPNGAPAPRD